jgi:hypothetical protein
MRPLFRTLATVAAGTLAATLVTGLVSAPANAKPAITLTPGDLPRGADVSVAHLEGKTVVDGVVRVTIKAPTVRLLGTSGSAYVVATANTQGGHGRIFRVTAQGAQTLLTKANVFQTVLSGDGGRIVATRNTRTSKSTITAYDATTGARLAARTLRGYPSVLDAQADQVLVGTVDRTLLWTTSTDSVGVVDARPGYVGDLSSDVLATFSKDPFDGGCTLVTRITTGVRLWKSCTEAVAAFNADASRIATVGILSDGPGPGRVDARTIDGKHLGRYQVGAGWFGSIGFETQSGLLLEVNGARKAFTARCTGTLCERASSLRPAETLRAS